MLGSVVALRGWAVHLLHDGAPCWKIVDGDVVGDDIVHRAYHALGCRDFVGESGGIREEHEWPHVRAILRRRRAIALLGSFLVQGGSTPTPKFQSSNLDPTQTLPLDQPQPRPIPNLDPAPKLKPTSRRGAALHRSRGPACPARGSGSVSQCLPTWALMTGSLGKAMI